MLDTDRGDAVGPGSTGCGRDIGIPARPDTICTTTHKTGVVYTLSMSYVLLRCHTPLLSIEAFSVRDQLRFIGC